MNSNDMMLFVEEWFQFFRNSEICQSDSASDTESIMAQELLTIQSIRDRMAALLDVVSEDSVTSSSEIEDNDKNEDDESQIKVAQSGNEESSSSVPVPLSGSNSFTFVKKRKLVSVNANDTEGRQTRIAKKTRETARMPKGALGAYTLLVKEIDETLARLFKYVLPFWRSFLLWE